MQRHYIYIILINLSISFCIKAQQLKMRSGDEQTGAQTSSSEMLHVAKQYTPTTTSTNVIRIKVTNEFAEVLKNGQFKISNSGAVQTGIKGFDQTSEELEIVTLRRIFPNAGKHERAHQHYGLHLWYEIILAEKNYKSSGINTLEQLKKTIGVVQAEYAQIYSLGNYSAVPINVKGKKNQSLNNAPNDRFFNEQWHYNNTGQSGGIAGSDIRLRYAWTQTTGHRDVIVSIHDGGVDTRHEDLAANMWVNTIEKNGRTGIDDDSNGYIDDVHGFNFVNHSGTIVANDHGTHVAGTVGAVTNNSKGVAGVAGGSGNNDGIRLMSTQVFTNTSGFGFENSFLYAADNGAVISQNSWSGGEEPSQALIDAINYFIARAGYDNTNENFDKNIQTGPMAGGVVIFAAGNYGAGEDPDQEIIAYPSALPQVISVANTDHNDHKDISSIWNDFVDLSAPGTEIASTFPGNQYGFLTGTSMACPHVSGVAALIVSKYKDENITPEQVRERLTQRTSQINTYEANVPYEGKMGTGRLNAYHALLDNDDHAPSKIDDLSIANFDAVSITLSWTAPSDGSLPSANHYEIRYSTNPITVQNFESAEIVKRVSEPSFSGEEETITIDGLEPDALYYFAIKTSDIFLNGSEISNVVSQKTLTAPSITVSPTVMNLTVNAQNGEASHTITIGNTGNAALSYNLSPNLQGRVILERGNPDHTQPEDVRFVGAGGGTEFITVTKFQAPQEGFNLLGIQAFYRTDNLAPEAATVIVRILRGGTTPTNATEAATTTISSLSEQGRWHSALLPSALVLAPGETFWIEMTYPEDATYPQAMDEEGSLPGTFYYGFDHKSYADLQTAEGFQEMHFKVKAVDDFQWLHISPTEGTANVNASKDHAIIIDPAELVNGNYTTFFQVSSNDPRKPLVEVPVNLAIIGGVPDLEITTTELDYGDTFVGATINQHLLIENKGQDVLEISAITISPDNGVFFTSETSLSIAGKYSFELPVMFNPSMLANFSATMTLVTNDPNNETITIELKGIGIPAPKLVISPDPLELSIASGSTATYEVTLENQGGNDLTFHFNNPLPNANLNGEDGTFGYHWIDSRESGGPSFEWNDIIEAGQSLSIADDGAIRVELPFDFPFYGESKNSVLISPNGFLTFGNTTGSFGGRISTTLPSFDDLNAMIAAYWVNMDANKKNASITYLQEAERFTVQYTNMPPSGQFLSGTATFQIVLYPDGRIMFFYKDMENSPLNTDYITGLENSNGSDALMISDKDFGFIANELAVLISPSKDFYVTNIEPKSGTLQPGASQVITFNLDAFKLMAGLHVEPLMISTNDPASENLSLPLNMNVTGASIPEISMSLLDFDTVFVGFDKTLKFAVSNKGRRTLIINESTIEGSLNFSLLESIFNTEIHPGATKSFTVSYFAVEENSEEVSAIRLITDNGEFVVNLKAKAVLPPILVATPEAISVTLTPGESVDAQLTLKNEGTSKLKYSLTNFSAQNTKSARNTSSTTLHTHNRSAKGQSDERIGFSSNIAGGTVEQGFHWIDNSQAGGPMFDWHELGNDADVQIMNLSDDSMEEVNLPFRFNYYGKSYQSIFITDNGLIGFDRTQISNTWNYRPAPTTTGNVHAFLAPFWFDFLPTELEPGKVFVRKSPESVTIQFEDAAQRIETPFFSIVMVNTFQVILYSDGSVKYQYLMVQSDNVGTIGLENYNGTEGITVSFNDDYLRGGLVILFTPFTEIIHDVASPIGKILPNQEAIIDFTITANETMVDGVYTEILHVNTNDPAKNSLLVPVKINIVGQPDIQAPVKHDLGIVLKNKAVESEFLISNSGTKAFTVHSVMSSHPLFIVDESGFSIAPGESKPITVSFTGTSETGVILTPIVLATDIDDTNGGSLTVKIPVSVKIQDAPALQLDVNTYEWYAEVGDELDVNLTIGNKQGGELIYSLSAVPHSSNEDLYQHSGNSKSFSRSKGSTSTISHESNRSTAQSRISADLSGFAGNIYYDPDKEADSFLGSGGLIDSKLDVATRFVVTEDYFTLTHAFVHYKIDYFTEIPVTLWVGYGGSNPDKTEIILEKQFFHPEAQNSSGFEAIVSLDTMLHFAKKDTLWMVLQYPGAAGKTQGVNLYADTAPDRYYYFDEGENEWLDANVLFPGLAFKVRALQQKVSWLELPVELANIQAGKNIDVGAIITAEVADGTHEARIRIEHNDPTKAISSIYSTLHVGTITSTPVTPEQRFSISPNPAKEIVNVKLMYDNEQMHEAILLGTDGKIRHNFKIINNESSHEGETTLSLPSMNPGLYILRLKTSKGTYSERIVIY